MTQQQRQLIQQAINELQNALDGKSGSELVSLIVARDQRLSPVISEMIKAL
jgi:hypothetical protein